MNDSTLPRPGFAAPSTWGAPPEPEPAPRINWTEGAGGQVFEWANPNPAPLLTISREGVLEFGPQVTPREAAQAIMAEWEKLRPYDEAAHALRLLATWRQKIDAAGHPGVAIETVIDQALELAAALRPVFERDLRDTWGRLTIETTEQEEALRLAAGRLNPGK